MDILVKAITTWLALDLFIIATLWYATSTLKTAFPNWWKSTVCDYAPESYD